MIGVLVPISFFVMLAALFIAPRYFKSREREALQATLRAAIEKGQPLPPEVIEAITSDAKTRPTPRNDLRAGIIWIGVALGIIGFAYAMGYSDNDAADAFWPLLGISAFPAFIGLALLVMAAINRGKRRL